MTKSEQRKLFISAMGLLCALAGDAVEEKRQMLVGTTHPVWRAPVPVRIDGKLDDAAWKNAVPVDLFVPIGLATPLSFTDARMAWDERYLYVAFNAKDEDITATLTQRDSLVWEEDAVEVFLRPDPARTDYYEINFSPQCMIYDSWVVRRDARQHYHWAAWNATGIRVASDIHGTLNDWTDHDKGYIVEIAIPFAELPSLKGRTPKAGEVWTFNLARYDYSVHLSTGRELSATAPLSIGSFRRYEEWRPLEFRDQRP